MKKDTSHKCAIEWCDRPRRVYKGILKDSYCHAHNKKATINRFLSRLYYNMNQRVQGYTHNRGKWRGKPILPRDVFMNWAKNHPDFLHLYKRYFQSRFDSKLAPSINRMDSKRGYTLDNMEWMTFSQNCALASVANKMKSKKAIYSVLGIKI